MLVAAQPGVESLFLASARRLAGPVRGVTLVVIGSFALLSVPPDALPLGFGLFTLILTGAAVDWWSGLTGRAAALASGFAVVRVVAVCATQAWTGGSPNLWALNTLTTTAITLQWEWPPSVTVPVTAGLLAVNLAVTGAEGAEVLVPRLVFECLLARLGFVLLRRSGRRTDVLRERRAALARAEALSLAQHRQEREYLALLHDTAAATFLMVAVQGEGADARRVAAYARRDLEVLTGAAGGATVQDSPVDLTAAVRAVAERSGLSVDFRDAPSVRGRPGCVPASVALAFVRAVREALVNVERHSGAGAATLSVTAGDGGSRVVVDVSDSGVGFRPAEVPLSRRGIRSSMVERLASVGGDVTIRSHPGEGTCVRMEWAGPVDADGAGAPGDGTGPSGAAGPTDAGDPSDPAGPTAGAVGDRVWTAEGPGSAPGGHVDTAMRRTLLYTTLVLQFGLSLGPLISQDYRSRALATGAFVALACVTAGCAWWVLRRRPLPAAVTAVGTLVVLAASLCATVAVAPDRRFDAPDWSFGLVQWHLLLLLLDRVRILVAALAAHLAACAGMFLAAGLPDRAALGEAGTVAFGAISVQAAVIVITQVLRRRSREALAAADEHDRLELRVLTARQWEERQRTLFAGQLGATLALLAGLADGALGPPDADIRQRCALAATQLRRLFAENDETPDPLVHEVTACVDVAERRGVDVSFAVSGAPVTVPARVRHRLTGPVATALSAARSHARVSVLRTEEDVRIAVVTDTDTRTDPGVVTTTAARVEVVSNRYGDFLRLEARWCR